jgi:signal transduction histidine kinase
MERTLADVRLILLFATAIITARLQVEHSANETWLVASLLAFLAYTVGMWVVVRYFPSRLRPAVLISSFLEVVLITALIWATYWTNYWATYGSSRSPFYLWYVFYVASISVRYGLQVCILGLAASVVLYTAVSMYPPNPIIYVPGFLGDTAFLFILAFLFGHISERQRSYQAQLSVANELGVALASLSTSREIIRLLVIETAGLLGAGRSWFAPYRDGDGVEAPPVALGDQHDELGLLVGRLGDWSPARVLEGKQIRVTNKPRRDLGLSPDAFELFPVKSLAAVPLYVRDVPVGVLYAADKQPRGFSGYDVELLYLIAAQAAPIIENIQLWERLKETAAAEERLRIARDLHDNFLQTLSAVKLHLERCRLLIDRDPEKAKASIERLHDISTQGLADVRSYLSQLRLVGPEPSRFRQAAERCAAEAAARGGFVAHTEVDVAEDALTAELSLAAFQILRELLNNAAMHSQAANVWVTAKDLSDGIELEVRDDGVGFDVEMGRRASEKGHLGLVGIEERVKELGGELEMVSCPGEGTSARIVLPIRETDDQT